MSKYTYEHARQDAVEICKIIYEEKILHLEKAISGIAPWLSASLTDDSCKEYIDACNAIFEADPKFKGY